MLISKGNLKSTSLEGKLAIVTGGGQGIGLEAARSLAWLGAKVVIAEINNEVGHAAADHINEQIGPGKAIFIHTDVGSDDSIRHLKWAINKSHGQVDIIINNATVTPIGSAHEVSVNDWDDSYRVNLRGPAMMAIEFLPEMIARNSGVFICVSSLGEAYLTAYETFKVAQVRLATTLNFELEDKNVFCFSINPGLVRTPRAMDCIISLAPRYGTTVEEFISRSGQRLVSAEAAGAGYAAAAVLAEQFRGQEINTVQVLMAAGIRPDDANLAEQGRFLTEDIRKEAIAICGSVISTLTEQAVHWSDRPRIEGDWSYQEFKRIAGMSLENWVKTLQNLENTLEFNMPLISKVPLDRLLAYYDQLQCDASRRQSDPDALDAQIHAIQFWQKDVKKLKDLVER